MMFAVSLVTVLMAILGLGCMGDELRKRKRPSTRDDVIIDIFMWFGIVCTLICGAHGVLAGFH